MAALTRLLGDKPFAQARAELVSRKLKVRESRRHPGLYLVQYRLGASDMDDPVSGEARGIVLQKDSNRVVAYPFDKFWNYNEGRAARLDWGTAAVMEKLDGSLIKVFKHAGEWIVGTNNCIDARDAPLHAPGAQKSERHYRMLFDEAAPSFPFEALQEDCTYMFELLHPELPTIVRHREPRLVHLATRRIDPVTGYRELPGATVPGIPQPRRFPLQTLQDVLKAAAALTRPHQDEGFVAVDAACRRVKIKSPMYVAAHAMNDQGSKSKATFLLHVLLSREEEEVLAYFPEHREAFEELQARFRGVLRGLQELAPLMAAADNRGAVAKLSKQHPEVPFGLVFALHDAHLESGGDIEAWLFKYLQKVPVHTGLGMLGLKE